MDSCCSTGYLHYSGDMVCAVGAAAASAGDAIVEGPEDHQGGGPPSNDRPACRVGGLDWFHCLFVRVES